MHATDGHSIGRLRSVDGGSNSLGSVEHDHQEQCCHREDARVAGDADVADMGVVQDHAGEPPGRWLCTPMPDRGC